MRQAGAFFHTPEWFSWATFRPVYGNYVEQAHRELRPGGKLKLQLGLTANPLPPWFAIRTKPFPFGRLLESNAFVMKLGNVS